MKTGNDVVARGSDYVAAGGEQSANLSSHLWTSMIESRASQVSSNNTKLETRSTVIDFDAPTLDAGSERPSSTPSDSRPSSTPSDSRPVDGASGSRPVDGASDARPANKEVTSSSRYGASYFTDSGSAERVPPNTASGTAERIQPGDNKPRPSVGGDIRPNSMVNQTLMNRFDQQSSDIRTSQMDSPVATLLSPQFHQQSQRMINDADNLPFKKIEAERANTQSSLNDLSERMSISEQRMLEASQRDPELQEMIPRMLQNVDNPRFHGMHGNDMNRLRQIAPDLADAMDRRRNLGQTADGLQRQIDNADTLMEKPTSTRFDYATNLIDSGLPENRDRAVQVLTELLNKDPDAARFRAPGSSGNRTMAELILRSNALDNKGFAAAFARAGGNPNTLHQQWNEDRWSFIERPGR